MSSPTYAVYARPVDVKGYLGVTDTDDDTLLLTCCQWARAQIDSICGRHFYPKIETITYDFVASYELTLDRDLIDITTLTNGDDSTITSTYYKLYPSSGPPYAWIELDRAQGVIFSYSDTKQQCLSVLGVWGYDEITEASGATVSSTYSASATSLTPSDMGPFAVGDLLKVGDEYLWVRALEDTVLRVVPAVNGSTAAAHAAATVIYLVRFPTEITNIATRLAAWRFKQRDGIFETTANPALGTVSIPAAVPVDIAQDLARWMRRSIA